METKRLEASVYGRVQMVMFRDFVTRKSRGLALVGEVRNMKDGSVSVTAEGSEDALESLLSLLHEGPILSKVEHVDAVFKEPSGGYTSFNINYE